MTADGLMAEVANPLGTRWLGGCVNGTQLSAAKERQEEVLDAAEHIHPPLPPAAV
jgi:hypothetical protein